MKRLFGPAQLLALLFAPLAWAQGPQPNPNALSGVTSTNVAISVISSDLIQIGTATLDRKNRTLEFPASVNLTEGLMEYFLVTTYGKVHESVLITDTRPYALHVGALLLRPKTDSNTAKPVPIRISLFWIENGKTNEVSAEACVLNLENKQQMTPGAWSYTGSVMVNGVFLSEREGSIISIIEDQSALIQNPRKGKENDQIWQPNKAKLPPADTMVTVRITFESPKQKRETSR
jgi:hypothetical protein